MNDNELSILMLNMMESYTVYMFIHKTVYQKTWEVKMIIIAISKHPQIPYLSYYKQ